jgi:hypothetical protein
MLLDRTLVRGSGLCLRTRQCLEQKRTHHVTHSRAKRDVRQKASRTLSLQTHCAHSERLLCNKERRELNESKTHRLAIKYTIGFHAKEQSAAVGFKAAAKN